MKPESEITLTVSAAATAVGLDRKTVSKRLVESGEAPNESGKFTVGQIVRALASGIAGSRARLIAAQAAIAEAELAEIERRTLDVDVVEAVWNDVIQNLRGVVLSFEMSREQRHRLIELLRAIPLSEYTEEKLQPSADDSAADA